MGQGFTDAGIETIAHVEKDRYAAGVLKRHYPHDIHIGDIHDAGAHNLPRADIISFGSPCQGFSLSGNQRGLTDGRSGLFSEAIRIVKELRPAIAVWENVPNARSTNGGRDFQQVLRALAECGAMDIAWRIYDAQYTGVPQRRRRVFLVADFRGERAGDVLFEPSGTYGSPPARTGTQHGFAARTGTLAASGAGTARPAGQRNEWDFLVPVFKPVPADPDSSLAVATFIEQGVGLYARGDVASTMQARDYKSATDLVVALDVRNMQVNGDVSGTIQAKGTGGYSLNYINPVVTVQGIRRLMPVECERLMGVPDGWTECDELGRPISDAQRYKMLGNGLAVPVARRLGNRLEKVMCEV